MNGSHILVHTANCQYLVRRGDIFTLRSVYTGEVCTCPDPLNRPVLTAELGPLLQSGDNSAQPRRHALIVPLRRRLVALLVDAVDTPGQPVTMTPLPTLLRERLQHPLAVGVATLSGSIVIEIDVRAIAMYAVRQAKGD